MRSGELFHSSTESNQNVAQPASFHEIGLSLRSTSFASAEMAGLSPSGPLAAFVGAALGCLSTSQLSSFGIYPAIASAATTVIICGSIVLAQKPRRLPEEFASSVFGGSFVGTTPIDGLNLRTAGESELPIAALVIGLALIAGFTFWLIARCELWARRPLARGFGGRSGAIAMMASLQFLGLLSLLYGTNTVFGETRAAPTTTDAAILLCIACSLGTLMTMLILRLLWLTQATTAVRISATAAVALVGLLILQLDRSGAHTCLNGFYAGCFIGMSEPKRLRGLLRPAMSAIVVSLVLVETNGLLDRVGGGLGFTVFVTVFGLVMLESIPRFLTASVAPHRYQPLAASGDLRQMACRVESRARHRPSLARSLAPRSIQVRLMVVIALTVGAGLLFVQATMIVRRTAEADLASPQAAPPDLLAQRPDPIAIPETIIPPSASPPSTFTQLIVANSNVQSISEPAKSEPLPAMTATVATTELPPPVTEALFREFLAWRAKQKAAARAKAVLRLRMEQQANAVLPGAGAAPPGSGDSQGIAPQQVRSPTARKPVRPVSTRTPTGPLPAHP